ncbi:MAG: tetratricopeptide repeat protein [Bacteriovoracaceae bacterium]
MKLLILLLFGLAHASDYLERGNLRPPPDLVAEDELNRVLFSETKIDDEELKKVKYYLINGEFRLAKVFLSKLSYSRSPMRPVIYRYMGLIAFIEGNFKESLRLLSLKELQDIPHYSKICTLKILNQIVLNLTTELDKEWAKCQIENPSSFNDNRLVWLETLIDLKLSPRKGITKAPFKSKTAVVLDKDELKVFLKLAIYLNQEKLIENQLKDLSIEQLEDPEVRELVGHIYFRLGSFVLANKYIEDATSPNSENIKGNLYLLREKYELAYAQFKLALEQKQNSQNAMERLLPLAWILRDWKAGVNFAEQVIASPQSQINKLTLLTAFQIQAGEYDKAKKVLANIADLSDKGSELEVKQLQSFEALMQNRPKDVIKFSARACEQNDLINCWVQYQMIQWDIFPLTLQRKEKIYEKKEWENLAKNDLSQPLSETVYVNQNDIEELDDKLIQIIPKTP